jgi:hypothetical protein
MPPGTGAYMAYAGDGRSALNNCISDAKNKMTFHAQQSETPLGRILIKYSILRRNVIQAP